ncbi:MAG: hypothetical protein ACRDQ0_10075 [Pseudonocardia sp.]
MITAEDMVPVLARGGLLIVKHNGRRRAVIDARKVGRTQWRVSFTRGAPVTVAPDDAFHRLAR